MEDYKFFHFFLRMINFLQQFWVLEVIRNEAAKIRVKHLNAGVLLKGLESETGGEQLPGGQGEQQRHRCHQGRGRARQICYCR